jgi:3-phosphoshikimate 1-carboxyvinyltransferase
MKLRKAQTIRGSVKMPGDKSISHRSAMLSAIAIGETRISNYSASADCASTLRCLEELGVPVTIGESEVVISGVGRSGLQRPSAPLDCGNSGTTMRLLSGILAGQDFDSVVVGDESLNKRPMQRIVEPLTQMGASIASTDGRAPLKIRGRNPLTPIYFQTPVASAQIKSAILLAGLNADGVTTVTESSKTRDHTERMLELFKIEVSSDLSNGYGVSINPGQPVSPGSMAVPGDLSGAAFFMVAAACFPGSDITLTGIGVNPTRSGIIEVLRRLGINIEISDEKNESNEPTATLRVRGRDDIRSTEGPALLKGHMIPNLIDELPILAVLGTQLEEGLEVRDAAELRHKEADRITAVVSNLRLMGADVTESADGFFIRRSHLHGAQLDSYGDHRISMAFAVAALLAEGETEIQGAECADVSFPQFFETLSSVTALA